MFFGTAMVAMVGDDSGEVKSQCLDGALRELLRGGVEDVGWKPGDTAIAGEKVTGK